jgi:hypothetical protein
VKETEMRVMKSMLPIWLFAAGLMGPATATGHLPYHGEGHVIVSPETLDWRDVPSMPAGAKIAVLEGDLSTQGPFTFRLKLPANFRLAPHTHPAYERVTVLQGTLHFAHGEKFEAAKTTAMPVGGFAVMSPGDPMFGYTEEETIIQLHGNGPWGIEYVDPADDPRRHSLERDSQSRGDPSQ